MALSAAALRAGLASREHLPRQQLLDRPYVLHEPCGHRGRPLGVAMLARSDAEHSIRPAEIVVGDRQPAHRLVFGELLGEAVCVALLSGVEVAGGPPELDFPRRELPDRPNSVAIPGLRRRSRSTPGPTLEWMWIWIQRWRRLLSSI